MSQIKIFVADDHDELERAYNSFFQDRKCAPTPRVVQIATNGEANYALLVVWVE